MFSREFRLLGNYFFFTTCDDLVLTHRNSYVVSVNIFAYRRKLGSTKFFPAPVYLKAGQKLFKWTITMLVPSLGIPRARRRVVSTDSRRAAHEPLTWLKLLHSGSACAHMSPKVATMTATLHFARSSTTKIRCAQTIPVSWRRNLQLYMLRLADSVQ